MHESSHFDQIAATRDYAYGHYDSQILAKTNPGLAVQNADSHEYFVENDPPLSK